MKHLRLFLVAIAAVFGLGANAQSWQADEVGEGYAILYNVGTGQYLGRGNGWGTQATVSTNNNPIAFKIELYGDAYKLRTNINGDGKGLEHLSSGTVYTDQSINKNSTWNFVQVATDNGPVYNIVSADNHGGGAKAYLTVQEGSTIVSPGDENVASAANSKWKVLSLDKTATIIGMDNATEANPVDATALIKNANFSYTLIQPWTNNGSNQMCGGASYNDAADGNPCAESWRAVFTVSQQINVPNGKYQVTAQAALSDYAHLYDGANYPVVFANSESLPFKEMVEGDRETSMTQLSRAFNAGSYVVGPIEVTVTDGKLTVGVKGTRNDTWCIWDNFQLKYLGALTDLTPYVEALAAAVAAAEAIEGTIPAAASQALAAVVAENNKEYSTGDEYTAAIKAIKDATDEAKALQAPYSRYQTIRNAVVAISSEIDTTDPDAQANAATSAEEIEAAVAAVRLALGSYLADANIEDQEIDLTAALIDNANIGNSGNSDYWVTSVTPSWQYNLAEFWNQQGANIKQNISVTMPAGYYTLSAIAYTRDGMVGVLNANENTMNIVTIDRNTVNDRNQGNAWIAQGNGTNDLIFNLAEPTTIEIGLTADNTTADYWTCFRSFGLKYLGTAPLAIFQQQLAEAAAAAALDGPVPAAAQEAFEQEIATLSAQNGTIEECLAAIEAIKAAPAKYNPLVAPYAEYKTIYPLVKAVADVEDYEELTEGAHATFESTLATLAEQVEAATTVEAVEAVNAALKQAGYTYAANANPTGDASFNLTFLLTNPDVTNFENWDGAEGWYTEQEDGNSQVMSNDAATSEDGTKTKFYEYWSNPAKANDLFALYQKVTLPLGTYNISCYAFAQDQYTGQNNVGVYFYANDTQGSAVTTARLAEANIEFVNNAEQEVKIGLKTIASNTYNWMGIGYVELYKIPAKTAEIADTDNGTIAAGAYGKITYDRSLLGGLNTLVLPFQTTKEEIGATTVLEYTGTTEADGVYTLNFVEVETLYPNVPYAVMIGSKDEPGEDVALPVFEDKTVVDAANELTVADPYYSFVGTYTIYTKNVDSPIVYGDYVAGATKFNKAKGGNGLKAYRAYFKKAAETPAEAKIAFNFGGTIVDGIEAVELLNNLSGNIYNLNGQKLQKTQKGINIVNGKKVLVK